MEAFKLQLSFEDGLQLSKKSLIGMKVFVDDYSRSKDFV